MQHMLHKIRFDATYETRSPAHSRDRSCQKDPCAVTTSTPRHPPGPRWRISLSNERFAGLLWQIVVVAIAIAVVAWLWSNALHNLSVRRISTGFAFLGREARMPIADTWLAYSPKNTYLRAFIVGVVNTLRVAAIGIVLATVLGTMIGIARLSSNWLLSRLAAVYVEVLRDVPLLLQLLFWYVLMQGLPAARAAWKPIDGVYLSNRGLVLPSIPIEEGNLWVMAAAALGLRRSFVLQHIVMPQALRVIIPPMTSQYLNLTKNSSLAVAVGYQDIVSIANTTLNQTGQAIEAIALIMAVFLTISLGISLFMNWYNARIALVER